MFKKHSILSDDLIKGRLKMNFKDRHEIYY